MMSDVLFTVKSIRTASTITCEINFSDMLPCWALIERFSVSWCECGQCRVMEELSVVSAAVNVDCW